MATQRYKKICIVCGKKYEFCSDCREYALQPDWKNIYHDENCREIAHILSDVGRRISIDEAKERIAKCDISNKENFNKVWREPLYELLGLSTDETNTEKVQVVDDKVSIEDDKETNKIVEEKVVEDKTTDKDSDGIVSEISNFKRKNKKKK